MAEYKGAAKEGARAMALMKRREKMKADIEAAKNKISEVIIVSFALGKFTSWPADRGIINLQKKTRGNVMVVGFYRRNTRLPTSATSFLLIMMW